MHRQSLKLMQGFLKTLDKSQELKILDVGSLQVRPEDKTYRDLTISDKWHYVGLDVVKGLNVDIVADDPYEYPFEDNTFDVVISGQTLEHVELIWVWIKELYRILKNSGIIYIVAPSQGPIHYDVDYWRIQPDGMKTLLRYANFRDIQVGVCKDGKWKDCWGRAVK